VIDIGVRPIRGELEIRASGKQECDQQKIK
jgi:hypothetical protein